MSIAEELGRASHLAALSNHELIMRLKSWVARERHVTLGVLFLLNEVESRKLHLDRYASLFAYCTDRLGYSRSAAGRRIAAARCLRMYPEIVPMLADGRLNLTTLCILSRVLTSENSREVLARAAGASQDEAERITAEFGKPRPARDRIRPVKPPTQSDATPPPADARSSDRVASESSGSQRLERPSELSPNSERAKSNEASVSGQPEQTAGNAGSESTDAAWRAGQGEFVACPQTEHRTEQTEHQTEHQSEQSVREHQSEHRTEHEKEPNAAPQAAPKTERDSQRQSQSMYDITFRASAKLVEKLRRAQDLLSSGGADPTLAVVIDRAIELLLDRHDPIRRQARRDARAARRARKLTTEDSRPRKSNHSQKESGVAVGDESGSGQANHTTQDKSAEQNGNAQDKSNGQSNRDAQGKNNGQSNRDAQSRSSGQDSGRAQGAGQGDRSVKRQHTDQHKRSAQRESRGQSSSINDGNIDSINRDEYSDSMTGSSDAVFEKDLRRSAGRRTIPQEVRDKVFLAYGNRCAHVGPEGRCPETRNLDLDHIVPIASGGTDDPDNLRPACRGHNQRFADLAFGSEFMNKHRHGKPNADRERRDGSPRPLEPVRN